MVMGPINMMTRKSSRMTMSNAVEKFRFWSDIQKVHRSYMVNFNIIEAIDHKFLKVGNRGIPFTERYRDIIELKLELLYDLTL